MSGSNTFNFKRFTVDQNGCAMKVGTDGVLLGAWCRVDPEPELDLGCIDHPDRGKAILDIGTGTGLIALQLAQRTEGTNRCQMKTTITVEVLTSILESGEGGRVSLSRCQLADLFGVYYGTITVNIKALIKSGAVNLSFAGTVVRVGNTVLPECYDMEMVIALAFRFNTPAAERIRRYVVERVTKQPCPLPPISVFVPIRENGLPN